MGSTERVAKWIVDFDYTQIPDKGLEQAKNSIIDTVGVALVGATQPLGVITTDYIKDMGGKPQASLIGSGFKTSMENAALANGTYAHADDYDDVGSLGHVGAVLVPAALAMSEQVKTSGKKMLEAYAAAFEVGSKLAGSIGDTGYFHNTSLLGTICAAVVGSKMYGFDADKTRAAMAIAASFSSGIMQNFGTFTKPMHAGHAAKVGVMAANLAKKGFYGDPNIFEAQRGFFSVYGGELADIRRLTEGLGKPMTLAESGVRIKAWPNCFGNHAALTTIFNLLNKHKVNADDIVAIEVVGGGKPPGILFREDPQKAIEGKFGLQYNLASAILDKKVDLSNYTDKKFNRPALKALMKKVTITQHPDFVGLPTRLRGGSGMPTIITLRFKDGTSVTEQGEFFMARTLHGEEVYDKFRDNAKIGGVSAKGIKAAVDIVRNLENVNDISELVEAVC